MNVRELGLVFGAVISLLIAEGVAARGQSVATCQALLGSSVKSTPVAGAVGDGFAARNFNPSRLNAHPVYSLFPMGGITQLGANLFRASIQGFRFSVLSDPGIIGTQEQAQWCWAASVKMVLNYYGIPITQSNVVMNGLGAVVDKPAGGAEILRSLNKLFFTLDGKIVNVQARIINPNQTIEWLKLLAGRQPLIAALAGVGGNPVGHAYVVTGAEFSHSPYGIQVHRVFLADPWPSNPVETVMSGQEFHQRNQGVYLVY